MMDQTKDVYVLDDEIKRLTEGFGITADAADVPNLQPSGAGYDGIVFRYLRRLVFQCSPAADAA